MLKLAIALKIWVPAPSEVSLSKIVTPKTAVFRPFFGRKWSLTPKPSTFDLIVLYIIGKLCNWRFWNSGGKLFFYHLWSARIFVMHPDWIATFIWFLVLRNPNRPLDHIKNMLVFFPLLLSLIHHFSLPVQRNIERNAHVSTAHCSLNFTRLGKLTQKISPLTPSSPLCHFGNIFFKLNLGDEECKCRDQPGWEGLNPTDLTSRSHFCSLPASFHSWCLWFCVQFSFHG